MNKGQGLGIFLFLAGFILTIASTSTINTYAVFSGNGNFAGSVIGIIFIISGILLFVVNK
ncbi:MAG: hypothetical protein Q7S56_01350 [Nanoarchaeota archaeon]|nr:hypothetical protein [Nanoarchaeota archaeon]